MTIFELITEHGRPIAALFPDTLPILQLKTVYELLPPGACLNHALAARWELYAVACCPDWAAEQWRRVPMLKPKTLKLAFL